MRDLLCLFYTPSFISKKKRNAFHYQKVAIFLCWKSVERECWWKGEERSQALFQILKSETCKQKFATTMVTRQQYKPCCQKPGPPGCFQAFPERSKEPVGRHIRFSIMGESSWTGELEKPHFEDASKELKQLLEASVPVNSEKATAFSVSG